MFHGWKGYEKVKSYEYGFQPADATGLSTLFTLRRDLSTLPPKRSWMLYVMELDDTSGNAAELNLITQSDGQTYFEAIYQGKNRHRFSEPVTVGKDYKLEFEAEGKEIVYRLAGGKVEEFRLPGKLLSPGRAFWGVEWWDMNSNDSYPIRFGAEFREPAFIAKSGRIQVKELEVGGGIQIGFGNVPGSWPVALAKSGSTVTLSKP
jgi:hypothetical protein